MKHNNFHRVTAPAGTITGIAAVTEATVNQAVQTAADNVLFWVTTAATIICAAATVVSTAFAIWKKVKAYIATLKEKKAK